MKENCMERHIVHLYCLWGRAVLYKNRFLHQDDFDNIYITEQFVQMDLMRSRQGKPTLLPLTDKEALTYIRPCEWRKGGYGQGCGMRRGEHGGGCLKVALVAE